MSVQINELTVGDTAPGYRGLSHANEEIGSDQNVGHPTVIFYFLHDRNPPCIAEIMGFRDLHFQFQQLGVQVLGVSPDTQESHAALARDLGLGFPLVSDAGAQFAVGFGVAQPEAGGTHVSVARRTFLIDANHRVANVYAPRDTSTHAADVLADVRHMLREEPRDVVSHAPVLIIPNVLPPDACRRLIEVWETQGNEDSGFMKQVEGQTVGMLDYSHKIRRDHFLKGGPDEERVKRYIAERVLPLVQRSFNYSITRREDFRVACYDASRGGYFRPHRDNTTSGTAHRRFAMSLLLNDDYEGGYLRFPEYGRHRYRPEAGGAVIFSCSLLHEATDVTAGRRFVLLSFFYGDQEAKMREEYNRKTGGEYKA